MWLTVCALIDDAANCMHRVASGAWEHIVIEFVFQKSLRVFLFSLSIGVIPSGAAIDVYRLMCGCSMRGCDKCSVSICSCEIRNVLTSQGSISRLWGNFIPVIMRCILLMNCDWTASCRSIFRCWSWRRKIFLS